MANIRGRKAAQINIRNVAVDKVRQVGAALFAAGEIIKADAQVSITTGAVSGANHVPSAPGQPPNEDTGTLRNSIILTQPAPLRVRISANAPYAAFLEFGTSRMAARPFMGPAARKNKKVVRALVANAVKTATKS